MSDTNRPPLWKVIDEAITEAGDDVLCNAASSAAIRALRDWLVAEEPEPRISEHCDRDKLVEWHRWDARQELRDRLTAEADRAERGELGHG